RGRLARLGMAGVWRVILRDCGLRRHRRHRDRIELPLGAGQLIGEIEIDLQRSGGEIADEPQMSATVHLRRLRRLGRVERYRHEVDALLSQLAEQLAEIGGPLWALETR